VENVARQAQAEGGATFLTPDGLLDACFPAPPGMDPHWRADGRELYYRALDGVLTLQKTSGEISRRYAPGPYSPRESVPAAWDREYLRVM